MSQILNELLREHGDELISNLSSHLNIKKADAEELVNKGVPVVMAGLRQQKNQVAGGSDLLAQIGTSLGGPALLGQLGSLFGASGLSTSPGQMNEFLGSATEKMAIAIAKKTGLSKEMVQKALVYLVPIVIAALFKFGQQAKAGEQPARQHAPQQAEGGNDPLGGLGSILDRDGDGSILDDILEMTGAGGGGAQTEEAPAPPTKKPIRRAAKSPGESDESQAAPGKGSALGGILRAIFGSGRGN